jgi:hypothetical protein
VGRTGGLSLKKVYVRDDKILVFLPAALSEAEGLRHWNEWGVFVDITHFNHNSVIVFSVGHTIFKDLAIKGYCLVDDKHSS